MPRRPPMTHYNSGQMAEVMATPPLLVGVPSIYGGGWEWEQMYAGIPHDNYNARGLSPDSSRFEQHRHSVPSPPASRSLARPAPSLGAYSDAGSGSLASKEDLAPLPGTRRPAAEYVEPKWVIHNSAPSRPTVSRETKAERTSRHLREDSERSGRGRSVSPPLPPIPIPLESSDLTPPPAPRELKLKPLGPRPRPRLSSAPQAKPPQAKSVNAERNPALLSPTPQALVGYFDDPPSPNRLSPGTVRSLEALVDDDQLYTLVDRFSRAKLDDGPTSPVPSPITPAKKVRGERLSVRDVWESTEIRAVPPLPATPVIETARVVSKQLPMQPKGSTRGGRGGRVTSAKQIWLDYAKENERVLSASASAPTLVKSRSASATSSSTSGVYAQPRPTGVAQARLKALIDKYDTAA